MNIFVKSLASVVKPVPLVRHVSTTCTNYKDDFQDIIQPESREPNIPLYIERDQETKEVKKARLLYQSRKRGAKPTPPEFDNEVMDLLKKHIKNEDRQARIMQPDL
ncbi:Succinate dehydrogenase assembly factor 2, mitochondrial [Anthophora quadrimaculata]